MRRKPYQEKILVSRADDEMAILSMLRAAVSAGRTSTGLALLNVFKGIPISNNAELLDINDRYAAFRTSPLQILTIRLTDEAVIRVPSTDTTAMGKVNYLDDTRNIVSLKEFSFADVHVDKRMAVRVELHPPLGVLLDVDGNRISGTVWDMSIDGCHMSTVAGAILEKAHTVILKLKFMHNNAVREVGIPARVQTGAPGSCILFFEHTAETENALSHFLYQRQVEIIHELKGVRMKGR